MAPDVTKKKASPGRMGSNGLLTALVVVLTLLSPALADSLAKKMHNIGDTLKSDLSGVLVQAQIIYSEPNINTTYLSDTYFNMKGMGILYNATTHVLNVIAHKDAYPEDFVEIRDGNPELAPLSESWRPLLAHYAGLVSIVVIVALFVVVFPLAGMCWCCCYCAHSRRQQPFDRKHDSCVKGVLALLLICVITLFMFGVVCSFVTDEHIETGAAELPGAQARAVADARAWLNATDAHQRHLLVTNYNELEKKLIGMIDSSGVKVSVQLGEFSRAVSVTTLNKMVQDLDRVRTNLALVKNVTSALRYNAERLDQGLRNVKHRLLHTLANCSQVQCRRVQEKYKIGELSADLDYSQLPDVTILLEKVNDLINGNIKTEVEEGQRVFNNLKSKIERSVNQHFPILETAITNYGKELANISQNITESVRSADEQIAETGRRVVHYTRRYVDDYAPYRRYIGIGVCAFILGVLLALVLGLLCGVCGKRPEGYGNNDCCNKGTGSRCLLTGMVVMFLLGWAAALVMLAYLLLGVTSQRFICDPLTDPGENRLFADLDRVVNLERSLFHEETEPDFNLAYVITNCHRNKTIFEVLHLHRILDLEELQDRVREELGVRVASLSHEPSFRQPNLVILKQSARVKLERLANSGLSDFPFDSFTDVLVTNITSIDLASLAQQLTATADEISGRAEFTKVTMELRDQAGVLNMYQKDIVDPMLRETAQLNDTAIELRDGLKFNHSSFKQAVEYLLDETAGAETFLVTRGPNLVRNLTQEFAEGVAAMLQEYLQRVVSAARGDVGRCGPLSNVYNATLNATCRKILMPINGFWLSLAWCLLLFFPNIVIAQKLAKLYTKTDPYPGPLVEAGSKRSTLDIEEKIKDFHKRAAAGSAGSGGDDGGRGSGASSKRSSTQLLLAGAEGAGGGVVCRLVDEPPRLPERVLDDLRTKLEADAKDEDRESGIHESE